MAHALLPPSGAHTWKHCPLWVTMNQSFPQDGSAESVEGDAAHWVAWEVLASRIPTLHSSTPAGTIVTEEMIEGGELIANVFRERTADGVSRWAVEQTLPCETISAHSFGTPDLWAFNYNKFHLDIFDYKFGHRFVDEIWNPQGLCYLDAIINHLQRELKINPAEMDTRLTVSFTIVQPRCFYKNQPVRTHNFRFSDARTHMNDLRNAADRAIAHPQESKTNDHCGDCPGRHACPSLQQAAYAAAEYANQRNVVELSPAAAALELKMLSHRLKHLEARVEGLKEITLANLKLGERVPYYRAEPGYGRTTWNHPDDQVLAIGGLFGINLSKPGLITPTQAIKQGLDSTVVKQYSTTPQTSTKLVEVDDNDAARVFGR